METWNARLQFLDFTNSVGPRPHYARGIWKRSFTFISLVCHKNAAFRKHSSNRRNLKTPALRRKTFWKQIFSKMMTWWQTRDFSARAFLKHDDQAKNWLRLRPADLIAITGNLCILTHRQQSWECSLPPTSDHLPVNNTRLSWLKLKET